ncbi:MAG: urease accessory protein UreE, partial [Deinococcota bacterium]
QHNVVELPMTSHDRQRVRRRIVAEDGTELALELPTGTTLHVGQVLHQAGDTVYVVTAAPEDVLVVHPRSLNEAAFVGHMIGNLHRDIDIADDGSIAALWDAPLEMRLQQAKLEVIRSQQPFRGKPVGEHSH